jgi:hypothetical protein
MLRCYLLLGKKIYGSPMITKARRKLDTDIRLRLKKPTGLLCFFALVLAMGQARAQETHVPDLGGQVPVYVLKARTRAQECLTDRARHDPCASVKIHGKWFKIAWDSRSPFSDGQ